jgi:hypothetical protein
MRPFDYARATSVCDALAILKCGEREAGVDPPAVDQDGAGAARTAVARALGARQAELVADDVEQRRTRGHGHAPGLAVDGHRDLDAIGKPGHDTSASPSPGRANPSNR